MKKMLCLSLLAAAMAFADVPAGDTVKRLYDTGMRQTEEGEFAAARLTLQSLADQYPKDPLALAAKGAIDATLLFEEGQTRAKAGKYETARLAFETLIAVYPENPLVNRARAAMETIAEKEKANRPVVKALEFRDAGTTPAEEIRAGLEEREVRLCAGKPYRARDLEQAKAAIVEILAAKGMEHVRIQAQTHAVPPHAVDVIFTVEKPRASLLRSPWRLATLSWLRRRSAQQN
jgi:outer membrane protein assembly factor BamD (BamD/ComL family)